jgi:Fe2+ transport system protein FeoA
MNLNNCPVGDYVQIKKILIDDKDISFRLMEMGLAPSNIVKIIQNGVCGGKIVARGRTRIGIDSKTAEKVDVELKEDNTSR